MVKPRLKFKCSSFEDAETSSNAEPHPDPRYLHQPVHILCVRFQQVSIYTQTHPADFWALPPPPPPPWKELGLSHLAFPQLPRRPQGGEEADIRMSPDSLPGAEQQRPHGALICLYRSPWGWAVPGGERTRALSPLSGTDKLFTDLYSGGQEPGERRAHSGPSALDSPREASEQRLNPKSPTELAYPEI